MEKNKLTYPCLRYTIPVISSICIISALLIMSVIKTDYTQIYFHSFPEKDSYYIYSSLTPIWKKIVLSVIAIALVAPYLLNSQDNVKSETFNAWFRLSIAAAMSILFFVIVSPARLHFDQSVSMAIDEYGNTSSVLSQDLQNRFALSSPLSMLLPLSFCTLIHCISLLKGKPHIKDICRIVGICATCMAIFSIYSICESISYSFYDTVPEDPNSIQPYFKIIAYIGAALVLSCIHDALQINGQEALANRNGKSDILLIGLCLFIICLPSLKHFCSCLIGASDYSGHYVFEDADEIQTYVCLLLGLFLMVLSVTERTTQHVKILPFYFILWVCVLMDWAYAQLRFDQIASVSNVAYEQNYVELPWIRFWCFPCVSMLLYTFFLILETPDRKTALILLAVCIFAAALTYLPAYVIELPAESADTEKSMNSIPIINLCIELMSPVLLIAFGLRQKHIKDSSV